MIPVKARVNPPCRQCGHAFDEPAAHCPVCGTRTGMPVPLRTPLRRTIDDQPETAAIIEADEIDESALDDVVLQPPVECLPPEPIDIEAYIAREKELEIREVEAPVARRVTLSSLMMGTLLVAACMGLARASTVAGIVAFLVIVPAYIRTLSAISFYRDQERGLERAEIMGIFVTSLMLAFVGLAAGGVAYAAVTLVSGLIVGLSGASNPAAVTTILGTVAAFVIVVLMIHKVWPVNQV